MKNDNFTKTVAVIAVAIVTAYWVTAFIMWEMRPWEWPMNARVMAFVSAALASGLSVLAVEQDIL